MRRLLVILCLIPLFGSAQRKMSTAQYVQLYKEMAIEKMALYGIPASITLSQGVLESGAGGSELAVKANNHFGIKCGKSWNGERVYHDDDAKGECFRKYKSVDDSYRDHSLFLTQNRRYAELFRLNPLDYKGWAHGLKAAGYATNPQYAQLLINTIEKNNLHQYDIAQNLGGIIGSSIFVGEGNAPKVEARTGRTWGRINGVKYIEAKDGDTWQKIAGQHNMPLIRLLRYNDLPTTIPIKDGDKIFVRNKKGRNKFSDIYTTQPKDTERSVAQKYGIRVAALKRLNPSLKRTALRTGQTLRLR